jgi:hypothetical protein
MTTEITKFLDELLRKPNHAEAIPWLKGSTAASDRTLGEIGTNEESLDLVAEAFEAGAVEVIAVEIVTYPDGSQNTGKLIVELPEDPISRERALTWCNELGKRLGLDPESDFGQRYTLVMLD